jgi:major type 1 subunit fimbrin (pilin)
MELEMKKVLLPLAALVLSVTASNAMAANGTVKFTGEIKQSTCEVTSDTQNKEVYLGTYPTSAFANIGDKSASKAFQISLDKCDAGDYSLRFDGNTVAGNPDLLSVSNVGGTGTAATGVGIEITDNNNKPFAIGDGSNIKDDVAKVTVDASGKATFNLQARYRSFSAVTAGLANATSPFTIEYK